jgi:recombinational DNA repair protein (RecF pathway)
MGRGVRAGGGRSGSGLDTFAEGTLAVHVKPTRELQTLKEFVPLRPRRALAGDVRRFGGAAVLAELVLRHALEEPNPSLFDALSDGLDRIERATGEDVVPAVLQEAWRLVGALGYRPVLDECVECRSGLGEELARFDLAAGGLRCARCGVERGGPRLGPGARAQLEGLLEGELPPRLDRPRAHLRLLSDFVTYHIGAGRPLPSLQVLVELLGDPSLATAALHPAPGGSVA